MILQSFWFSKNSFLKKFRKSSLKNDTFIYDMRANFLLLFLILEKKILQTKETFLDFHESFHFSLLGLGFQIDKQLYKHQKFLKFINYEL